MASAHHIRSRMSVKGRWSAPCAAPWGNVTKVGFWRFQIKLVAKCPVCMEPIYNTAEEMRREKSASDKFARADLPSLPAKRAGR